MPLIFSEIKKGNIKLGVWKIDEEEDFFVTRSSAGPLEELSQLKGRRRIEYLASRHLLMHLLQTDEEVTLIKDSFGKPYLQGHDLHISLSHTRGYAAAILGAQPVGIDIQVPVEKISRIAHKFISDEECRTALGDLSLVEMHLIWGAKESMFKIYGRKQMDFKRDLFVAPMELQSGRAMGEIRKSDLNAQVDLTFYLSDSFVLIYGVSNTQ